MKAYNKQQEKEKIYEKKCIMEIQNAQFSTNRKIQKKNLIITRKYYEPKKMVISVSELLQIGSFLISFYCCWGVT